MNELLYITPFVPEETNKKAAADKGDVMAWKQSGHGGCQTSLYGVLGPFGVCGREIGTIGFRVGGVVVCYGCAVKVKHEN